MLWILVSVLSLATMVDVSETSKYVAVAAKGTCPPRKRWNEIALNCYDICRDWGHLEEYKRECSENSCHEGQTYNPHTKQCQDNGKFCEGVEEEPAWNRPRCKCEPYYYYDNDNWICTRKDIFAYKHCETSWNYLTCSRKHCAQTKDGLQCQCDFGYELLGGTYCVQSDTPTCTCGQGYICTSFGGCDCEPSHNWQFDPKGKTWKCVARCPYNMKWNPKAAQCIYICPGYSGNTRFKAACKGSCKPDEYYDPIFDICKDACEHCSRKCHKSTLDWNLPLCECRPGFYYDRDLGRCHPQNHGATECPPNHKCGAHEKCVNTKVGHQCECRVGYRRSGMTTKKKCILSSMQCSKTPNSRCIRKKVRIGLDCIKDYHWAWDSDTDEWFCRHYKGETCETKQSWFSKKTYCNCDSGYTETKSYFLKKDICLKDS